jgi:DNA-binding Lrp family transcriptional regulator
VAPLTSFDRLDAELLGLLAQDPRLSSSELAARLGTTRNTVHARLTRLTESGVLGGFAARLDLERLGLAVLASLQLDLAQDALDAVVIALRHRAHVLEVTATTGRSDLSVRVAARSHAELQAVVQDILAIPGVVHTVTEIALTTPVPYRVGPLLAMLTGASGRGRARPGAADLPD